MDPKFWQSDNSDVFLNPRLSPSEQQKLKSMVNNFHLPSHIWVASSGSTETAENSTKLVALSKSAFLNSAKAVNQHLQVTENDRWAQVLPLFHVGGLGIEARAFLSGSKVFSALDHSKWNAFHFHSICAEKKITLASLVPAQVFDLVQSRLKAPSNLRAVVVGGGTLSTELYIEARKLSWPLLPSFGMTEACSQIATATMESPKLKILSHLEAKINADGFLQIRGSSLLTGFAQIQAGNDVWQDPKDADGWLTTEDRVELEGSFLNPLGRRGDFVKVLGEGVSLLALQKKAEDLMSHFGQSPLHLGLMSRPHPRLGHELFFVFEAHVPEKIRTQIFSNFNESVLPFERIQQIQVVEKIPRTELGKLKQFHFGSDGSI